MQDRAEAEKLLKGFVMMIKNQFAKTIMTIWSDNKREFTSGPMQAFYLEHGILHESTC